MAKASQQTEEKNGDPSYACLSSKNGMGGFAQIENDAIMLCLQSGEKSQTNKPSGRSLAAHMLSSWVGLAGNKSPLSQSDALLDQAIRYFAKNVNNEERTDVDRCHLRLRDEGAIDLLCRGTVYLAVVNADEGDDASAWCERRSQIQRIPEGLWSLSELTERNYSCKMEGLSCFVVLMVGRIWRYLSTAMLAQACAECRNDIQGAVERIAESARLAGCEEGYSIALVKCNCARKELT